jgi:transcriptional regulator with XRE-family HTH domain
MKNIIQGPISGKQLRAKRAAAGIPGHAISRKAGISRGKLSEVETGVCPIDSDLLQRIDAAIDAIVVDRTKLSELASKAGLSLEGVRM